MIIEMIITALYNIFNLLLVFEIPQLPASAMEYVTTLFDYLVVGAGLLNNYVPLGYLLVLFGVLLAVDAAILIYHFVMWIIRKIPMLGMS